MPKTKESAGVDYAYSELLLILVFEFDHKNKL